MPYKRVPEWWRQGGWRIGVALLVSALFLGAVVTGVLLGQRSASHRDCLRINRLQSALVVILQHSEKGLPANHYYRTHPLELVRAERQTEAYLHLIQRARCIN